MKGKTNYKVSISFFLFEMMWEIISENLFGLHTRNKASLLFCSIVSISEKIHKSGAKTKVSEFILLKMRGSKENIISVEVLPQWEGSQQAKSVSASIMDTLLRCRLISRLCWLQ